MSSNLVPIDSTLRDGMSAIGIEDILEYLLYPPASYRDYRFPIQSLKTALEESANGPVVIRVKVTHPPTVASSGRGPKRVSCRVTDGVENASMTAFGNIGVWLANLRVGEHISVTAKVEYWQQFLQLKNPEIVPALYAGRIVPKYRGKDGVITSEEMEFAFRRLISSPLLDSTVQALLGRFDGLSEADILRAVDSKYKKISEIIRSLHNPSSREDLEQACKEARRMNAFVMLNSAQAPERKSVSSSVIKVSDADVNRLIAGLAFKPTSDQIKAINEIMRDLKSDLPMDRLLSGDVGCGKTISYAIPAVCSRLAGATTVVILPNSLLAQQVAGEIGSMFPGTPVELILGGGDRPQNLDHNPIIVGTSAVFWWIRSVKKNNPGFSVDFMIIDEQQKLGSKQKSEITSEHTNILEASATAIPRTLALVHYSGKSISRVEKCPVEKDIYSRIVEPGNKRKAADHLLQIVRKGYQIAIVYPLKERGDEYRAIHLDDKDGAAKVKDALKKTGIKSVGRYIQDDMGGHQLRLRIPDKSLDKVLCVAKKNKWVWVDPYLTEKERVILDKNVEDAILAWEKKVPGSVVGIHGGMTTNQKTAAMQRAKDGLAQVIITTSVIEIGLTMPDLRGLLVVNAERYGASTLHQLRGRLSRHGGKGFFYMAVDAPESELPPESLERLKYVEKYNNGRILAELDMHQRGFGDISIQGQEQSGYTEGVFKGLKAMPSDIEELVKIQQVTVKCEENNLP